MILADIDPAAVTNARARVPSLRHDATSKAPESKRAALGVRAHSGWAAAILLSGLATAPKILDRRRIPLCDPAVEGSKQPFHHADSMTFPEAQAFIARCDKSTDGYCAYRAQTGHDSRNRAQVPIERLRNSHGVRPRFAESRTILASHALIHAAEGEFYRKAVARACQREEIAVSRVKECEVEGWLASRVGEKTLKATVATMGKALGPPWTMDEKLAAMIAWLYWRQRTIDPGRLRNAAIAPILTVV